LRSLGPSCGTGQFNNKLREVVIWNKWFPSNCNTKIVSRRKFTLLLVFGNVLL
jgi:hypothetical protein